MKESWNFDLEVSSEVSPIERENLATHFSDRKNLQLQLEHELEPTESEKRIIDESRGALDDLVQRLDLPPVHLPDDHVHLVTEEEFRRLVSEQAESKVVFGHVYLRRSENPVEFCRLATHELCHVASRTQLRIVQHADEEQIRVWTRQLGFSFQPKKGATFDFNGINEGTTELCAIGLRRYIEEHSTVLDDEQRRVLSSVIEYRPWVVVVDYLVRLVAQEDQLSRPQVRNQLFRDYFSGEFNFIKRVDQYKKGASKALRLAECTKADAIRVAEELGLTDALRVIG